MKRGVNRKPEGMPFTVFLNPAPPECERLTMARVVEDMPPGLECRIRPKTSDWIVIDCIDEPTCILIAMEFNPYWDGHMYTDPETGERTRYSPPVLSQAVASKVNQ